MSPTVFLHLVKVGQPDPTQLQHETPTAQRTPRRRRIFMLLFTVGVCMPLRSSSSRQTKKHTHLAYLEDDKEREGDSEVK